MMLLFQFFYILYIKTLLKVLLIETQVSSTKMKRNNFINIMKWRDYMTLVFSGVT